MFYKIIAVALITIVLNLVVKQYKPEFSILISVCGGLLIFIMLIDEIKVIVDEMINVDLKGVDFGVISSIIKVLGIGYITEFTANIAEESGNKSIATKIILGGKIAICVATLPIIKTLLSAILSLIR